jgi:hypothetical protein
MPGPLPGGVVVAAFPGFMFPGFIGHLKGHADLAAAYDQAKRRHTS